jgi:hypothetical protein
MDMRRQHISSSSIRSAGYDKETKTLEVEFVSGGVYQYKGVPEYVYTEFLASPSRGVYFSTEIRDHYPTTKVSEA